MSIDAVRWPLTVYYDAACPLCAREMHTLVAADRGGHLRLVDVSAATFADADARDAGLTRDTLLAAIHARDADGQWYRGIDVFVLVYRAAGIESLARLWDHRRLRPLWQRLYPWVARHRMRLSALGFDRLVGAFLRLRLGHERRRCATKHCVT